MFPREYTGQFAENDIYIDCMKGIKVFHYGYAILQTYIPSIGRGNNIIKAITEKYDSNIIFDIEKTDSEILFKFKVKDDDKIFSILQPKTNGARISPFSTKNLPKTKYVIPDKDLNIYKEIVKKLPQNQLINLVHTTNSYLETLLNKNYTKEQLKTDMALKGFKGKEYIHSIGKWSEYIKYLEDDLWN